MLLKEVEGYEKVSLSFKDLILITERAFELDIDVNAVLGTLIPKLETKLSISELTGQFKANTLMSPMEQALLSVSQVGSETLVRYFIDLANSGRESDALYRFAIIIERSTAERFVPLSPVPEGIGKDCFSIKVT